MKVARLNIIFIKHKMIDLGINRQKDLAKILGLPSSTVNEWFRPIKSRKTRIPNAETLAIMIELFNCDFNQLLEIVEVKE
jgi:hypothetical protein